jgi:hypothetical protein
VAGRARRTALLAAAWLALAALVVLPHVHAFTQLSKIDEYQHVDYLDKTMRLEHVAGGEKVGQTAMREQACRGIDLETVSLPPCASTRFEADSFPGRGFNHTYQDPPTYYLVTGALVAVVTALPGTDSIVTAGRSIGVLWLAAGLAVTFVLCRRLGAGLPASAGATLLVAATPVTVHAVTTVTTDAPLLAVGGLLVLTAVSVAEDRASWWWLAPAALLAMGVKSTALPAVGVVVVLMLLHRRWKAAGATVVGALVPTFTWGAFSAARALPEVDDIPVARLFETDRIGLFELARGVETTFSPVVVPERAPFLHTLPVDMAVQVVNLLLILGVAAVAWSSPARSLAGRLGVATFLGLLATGPGYVLMLFVLYGVSYIVPGRYGLTLLPAAAACLALAASRRRAGEVGLPVLGAAGVALLLAHTLTA